MITDMTNNTWIWGDLDDMIFEDADWHVSQR